jgi:hypothetical protein
MTKEMKDRLTREALNVLSYVTPSTASYREVCRDFLKTIDEEIRNDRGY